MKKIVTFCLLFAAMLPMKAQNVLSLDSCRAMALRNNKQINASRLKKDIAYNLKKSARTKYLPKVDALGGYEWFNREISLLNSNQKSAISNSWGHQQPEHHDGRTCQSGTYLSGGCPADWSGTRKQVAGSNRKA